MPISTILSEIEARRDVAGTLELVETAANLTAALRKAVNTLETMGMTETLSHVEKLLGGDHGPS